MALFDPESEVEQYKRTTPYLLMNYISDIQNRPDRLVALQYFVAALAMGLLVYVLARANLLLGVGVGLLSVWNLNWANFNRTILTQGPYTSFHVLAVALLIWHYQRRERLPYWELAAAGMVYGWTGLFRSSSLPLIVPVLAGYYWFTRSARRTIAVAAGFGIFLVLMLGFSTWRYDEARFSAPYAKLLPGAVYTYHLFSPENGPRSLQSDEWMRACNPYLDYDDGHSHK